MRVHMQTVTRILRRVTPGSRKHGCATCGALRFLRHGRAWQGQENRLLLLLLPCLPKAQSAPLAPPPETRRSFFGLKHGPQHSSPPIVTRSCFLFSFTTLSPALQLWVCA